MFVKLFFFTRVIVRFPASTFNHQIIIFVFFLIFLAKEEDICLIYE